MSTDTVPNSTVREIIVAPFAIEADHPRNSDLLLQCIPNCRLRSAISGSKGIENQAGDEMVPLDQARGLAAFPRTPGMQLSVDPAGLRCIVSDPLFQNEALCDRITTYMKDRFGYTSDKKVRGVPPREEVLDVHQMKSLCRELLNIVNSGEAKIVKGQLPDLEEITELPGHFLLNPGLRTATTQPRYEKDWDQWVDRLSHSGG